MVTCPVSINSSRWNEWQAGAICNVQMRRTIDGGQLQLGAVLGEAHALHLAALHGVDKLGVAPLVALWQARGVTAAGAARHRWRCL